MYVCTRIDNGPLAKSEGVAGEDLEQQLVGEGLPWPPSTSLLIRTPSP
jgi:hypothetical protein